MKYYLILLLSIFIFSCQQSKNKNVTMNSSDTIVLKKNKPENKQIGDTLYMYFKENKDSIFAEGLLDSIHPRIYVKIKNNDLSKLKASIIPSTANGNIRFNQIISPDNTSDGPFGRDLTIELKQKGNYILVIGHSLMADNAYWGKFEVKLEKQTE